MSKNMSLWLLQRLSAVALIALLIVHFWVLHFAEPHSTITMANVHSRLNTFRFLLVDYGLLVLALFHGLNGIRSIALDHSRFVRYTRGITWSLLAVGVVFALYGGTALWYAAQFVQV